MAKSTPFPRVRMRRLRYNPALRQLVRSVHVTPSNLILPLFIRSGNQIRQPIGAMPGQFQLSVDQLADEAREAAKLGLGGIILFGIPDKKDAVGSDSCQDDGIIQQAIQTAKDAAPQLLVVTDVCFCEYTDHGHCGVLHERGGQIDVDNDATLKLLGQQAHSHVRAGADLVAPSGMMDGMVGAIRETLDEHGHHHIPIMSYAVKYASAFYGPFREAAESTPQFGDRRTYQMDPMASASQALREAELDLEEGADLLMVKPALAYLDIIRQVNETYPGTPLAAYNVSGEYSMVKAAAEQGWIDEESVVLESLGAMKRAGATTIITYWAKQVAQWLGA